MTANNAPERTVDDGGLTLFWTEESLYFEEDPRFPPVLH